MRSGVFHWRMLFVIHNHTIVWIAVDIGFEHVSSLVEQTLTIEYRRRERDGESGQSFYLSFF